MSAKEFWKSILSSDSLASSKRLITLIMAAHFIVTSFLVSFFVFYLIIYTPKGSVNEDLVNLLDKILESDFYVILSGLGFITVENFGSMMLEKARSKADANVKVGSPTADTINVETVNVDQSTNTNPE